MEVYDWEPSKCLNARNVFMLIRLVGCSCRALFLDDVAPRVATLAPP